MRWHPSWEEIQYWLTAKEHEFSLRETKGLRVNGNQWKDRYMYIDNFPDISHMNSNPNGSSCV
jgi:hypothetical protein